MIDYKMWAKELIETIFEAQEDGFIPFEAVYGIVNAIQKDAKQDGCSQFLAAQKLLDVKKACDWEVSVKLFSERLECSVDSMEIVEQIERLKAIEKQTVLFLEKLYEYGFGSRSELSLPAEITKLKQLLNYRTTCKEGLQDDRQ